MTICDIAANAIRNATLYKEVKDRVATLSSLYDAGLALNSVLEPHALLEVLFKIAMDELHAERIVFFRQIPGNSYFKAELCLGFEEDLQAVIYKAQYPVDNIQTPIGWVQAYGLPLKILNTSGDIGVSIGDPKVRSVLWMPINHGNNLRGILGVMSTAVNAFDQKPGAAVGAFFQPGCRSVGERQFVI